MASQCQGGSIAYVLRLVGDLFVLILGAIAVILFSLGMLKEPHWVPSAELKWGFLGVAFVVASYRIWARSEVARTSDAIDVLVRDAVRIMQRIHRSMEYYHWPPLPTLSDGSHIFTLFASRQYGPEVAPVFRDLGMIGDRIQAHAELVQETLMEHGIDAQAVGAVLSRDNLITETAVFEITEYIDKLRLLARPPKSVFEKWSVRRFQR